MKPLIITLLVLISYTAAKAADTTRLYTDSAAVDSAKATTEPAVSKKTVAKPHLVSRKVYRLQVIKTHDRKKALKLKAELMYKFPGKKCYLVYSKPYFRIRLGNFENPAAAKSFKRTHLKRMPHVYVIRDRYTYMWYPPQSAE